jgi:hypothetical protein
MRTIKRLAMKQRRLGRKGEYDLYTYEVEDELGNVDRVDSLRTYEKGDRVEMFFDDDYNKFKMIPYLNQKNLKKVVYYDGSELRWLEDGYQGRNKKDEVIGYIQSKGYRAVAIYGRKYLVHRLVWLYCYGEMPKNTIDHINGDKLDNRIENLRDVTNQENHKNMPQRSDRSIFPNVYKHRNRWIVRVGSEKSYYGLFEDLEEAIGMALTVRDSNGYHENHNTIQ